MNTTELTRNKESVDTLITNKGNGISEAILDANCQIFTVPHLNGLIGYLIESKRAIVFGDPVCSLEERLELTQAFRDYCHKNQLSIIYLLVSESFTRFAQEHHLCSSSMQVAEELVFNPQRDPTDGPSGNRLRNKMSHAQHLGLTVHEYLPHDAQLERQMQMLADAWQKSRKGPQIYLGRLNFFDRREGRRWFYVKEKEKVIAVALLRRVDSRQGWLIKFLISIPKATRGTSEWLMLFVMDTLRKENCTFLTNGVLPADQIREVRGLNSFSAFLVKTFFTISKWLFRLDNRKTYWKKFQPTIEKSYILFDKDSIEIGDVWSIFQSLKIDI